MQVSGPYLRDVSETLDERIARLESRVDELGVHPPRIDILEARVHVLEVGLLRVERQLHLVFDQGQANSKALGEQRLILERIQGLMEVMVHQATPSVEVYRGR